jgi:ATP-binding cassette, subfamily C, bacterial CydD
MRAVAPRLLRHARAARAYLVMTVLLGLVVAGLIVAQAALLAHALSQLRSAPGQCPGGDSGAAAGRGGSAGRCGLRRTSRGVAGRRPRQVAATAHGRHPSP